MWRRESDVREHGADQLGVGVGLGGEVAVLVGGETDPGAGVKTLLCMGILLG